MASFNKIAAALTKRYPFYQTADGIELSRVLKRIIDPAEADMAYDNIGKAIKYSNEIHGARKPEFDTGLPADPLAIARVLSELRSEGAPPVKQKTILAAIIYRWLYLARPSQYSAPQPHTNDQGEIINSFLERIGGRGGTKPLFQAELGKDVETLVRNTLELTEINPGGTTDLVYVLPKVAEQSKEERVNAFLHLTDEVIKYPETALLRGAQALIDMRHLVKMYRQDPQHALAARIDEFAKMNEEIYIPMVSAYGHSILRDKLQEQQMIMLNPDDYVKTKDRIISVAKEGAPPGRSAFVRDMGTARRITADALKKDILNLIPEELREYCEIETNIKKVFATREKLQSKGVAHDIVRFRIIVKAPVDVDQSIEKTGNIDKKSDIGATSNGTDFLSEVRDYKKLYEFLSGEISKQEGRANNQDASAKSLQGSVSISDKRYRAACKKMLMEIWEQEGKLSGEIHSHIARAAAAHQSGFSASEEEIKYSDMYKKMKAEYKKMIGAVQSQKSESDRAKPTHKTKKIARNVADSGPADKDEKYLEMYQKIQADRKKKGHDTDQHFNYSSNEFLPTQDEVVEAIQKVEEARQKAEDKILYDAIRKKMVDLAEKKRETPPTDENILQAFEHEKSPHLPYVRLYKNYYKTHKKQDNGYRAIHTNLTRYFDDQGTMRFVRFELQIVGKLTHANNHLGTAAHQGTYKHKSLPTVPDATAKYTVSVFDSTGRIKALSLPATAADFVASFGADIAFTTSRIVVIPSTANVFNSSLQEENKRLHQGFHTPLKPGDTVVFSTVAPLLNSKNNRQMVIDACKLPNSKQLLTQRDKELSAQTEMPPVRAHKSSRKRSLEKSIPL